MAGGLSLEDHIFKAFALGAPYIKAICLGRATMTAAMVGNTIGEMIKEGKVPAEIGKFGTDIEHIFIFAAQFKERYGKDFEKIPAGAIGMITYFDRLNAGLQQLMAGRSKVCSEAYHARRPVRTDPRSRRRFRDFLRDGNG